MSNNQIKIAVESAGYDHGNSSWITVNDEEPGMKTYTRGLNVGVFDESTGALLESQSFDLFADAARADDFAKLIAQLPEEQIVAIAVQDDASINLSEAVKQACESVGSTLVRELKLRSSWAIVGRKGASRGSVPEQLSDEKLVLVDYTWSPPTTVSRSDTPEQPQDKGESSKPALRPIFIVLILVFAIAFYIFMKS